MPWAGGVYTRGYPSWTNDANANLPISATKFDTEDNDFAAGLNNCLTVDGLNKPIATLTWAQALSVLSLAVTGAGVPQNGIYLPSANTLGLATNAALRGSVNATGNWSFVAPTSGTTVAVPGVSGGVALNLTPAAAADLALVISGGAGNQAAARFDANNAVAGFIGSAGATNQLITGSAAGDFNIRTQGGAIRWSVNSGAGSALLLKSTGILQNADDAGALFDTGWRDLPQRTVSTTTATVAADRGKSIRTSTGINLTLAAAGTYPVGTVIVVFNSDVANTNIIAGSGDTLVLAGTATTGNRVVAPNGFATCYYGVSGFWYIGGPGVS